MTRKPFSFRAAVTLLPIAAALSLVAAGPAKATSATFAVNTVWDLDGPLQAGDYMWDEEGAPRAPVRIVVDLSAEMLYVYRGGVEIGRSSILYGDDRKPTPTGVFKVLNKYEDHVSSIYGSPMPYTLRLTNDGISIHGSQVEEGYATHGCVGLPTEFAEVLFRSARVGDQVLITRQWMPDAYEGQADYR